MFICSHGRFIAAELKADKGVITPHQELFIDEVKRVGAVGGICYTIQDTIDLINEATYCSCSKTSAANYCPHCGRLTK